MEIAFEFEIMSSVRNLGELRGEALHSGVTSRLWSKSRMALRFQYACGREAGLYMNIH